MLRVLKKVEQKWGRQRRFKFTLDFVAQTLPRESKILDLGTPNELSDHFTKNGYVVFNTQGEDLDEQPEAVAGYPDVDAVTAFEIFEHLLNPLGVLKCIKAKKIFVTVPLKLWFARSYRNPADPWDRHFHEFEDWQLDWLLEKSGWKIQRRKKWTSPSFIPGFRGVLRWFTHRYYAVEAIKE